jgi:predicted AAA+ superfamily ATPase
VPKHGLNSALRIPRDALVQKAIQLAEENDQNVFIRGAAGTGKTVLLELITQRLQKDGKRAMFIQHASDFANFLGDINILLLDEKPLYLLIDEAHMSLDNTVSMYLKKPHSAFFTIAAGIPSDARTSAMFFQSHPSQGNALNS